MPRSVLCAAGIATGKRQRFEHLANRGLLELKIRNRKDRERNRYRRLGALPLRPLLLRKGHSLPQCLPRSWDE